MSNMHMTGIPYARRSKFRQDMDLTGRPGPRLAACRLITYWPARSICISGAFIMQVVDIGLSEIDAFSVQYARAFKPCGFRLMFVHSSNWRLAV